MAAVITDKTKNTQNGVGVSKATASVVTDVPTGSGTLGGQTFNAVGEKTLEPTTPDPTFGPGVGLDTFETRWNPITNVQKS